MLETHKKHMLDILFERLDRDDCIVFLFGSHATDETVGSSDIDIGILCSHEIPAGIFMDALETLNAEIPLLREIDLVDFSTLDDTVRREALEKVAIWHAGKNCRELLKSLMRR